MRPNGIYAKLKSSQCSHFSRIRWGGGGPGRSVGALPCAFAGVCSASLLVVALNDSSASGWLAS